MTQSPSYLSNPLVLLGLVFALGIAVWLNLPEPKPEPIDNSDAIRIMMVGNSYTKYNDLCRLLGDMSRKAGKKVFVVDKTILGSRLSQHVPALEKNEILVEQDWDFILLQGRNVL